MKAFEFQASLNANQTLPVPQEVAAQLQSQQAVHVILLVPESPEDAAWQELTTEQFLKGYAESDAIYDQLSTR